MDLIHAASLACDWLLSNCRDGNDLNTEARAMLREHGWPDRAAEDVADAIGERMAESALSVEVRSEWQLIGGELQPAEFRILLSTGGPALRIVGELSAYHGGPINPVLQWQDWGTPWTEFSISADEAESLDWFCQLFTFEI